MGSHGKWASPEQLAIAWSHEHPEHTVQEAYLAGYAQCEARLIKGVGHGTTTGYTRGCRCDDCKKAYSEYQKMYRGLNK